MLIYGKKTLSVNILIGVLALAKLKKTIHL